jgi:hypothetical protein
MKLSFCPIPSEPEVVTYTVSVDDVVVGSGMTVDAAQRLYNEATGYVVMTNQYGACYAYKGRGFMGGDEPDEQEE